MTKDLDCVILYSWIFLGYKTDFVRTYYFVSESLILTEGSHNMERKYDVIIVGTGAAGLFAALQLPSDYSVLMITKDEIERSDSYLAQGGISCLLNEEDYDSYYEDTLRAGRYENNPESVKIMIEESKGIIQELVNFGVDFAKDEDGNFIYTREGAHSEFRILYHQDVTGKEITSRLIDRVKERSNIEIRTFTTMIDFIVYENACRGVVVEDNKTGERQWIRAKHVILATGGLGGLFFHSTNFRHITGDSFAIALKNGIELENINYIQIHPTTLYSQKDGRRFLISESVRGEGAVLLNRNKERFTDELQPRDVVTNAIKEQMKKDGTEYVYLSIAHLDADEIKNRFPNIYGRCLEEGYDLAKECIPVTPAQHYLMGGIKASVNGETSLAELYAAGEVACNGVHGANRLASNSLLESLVFAKRAAGVIKKHHKDIKDITEEIVKKEYPPMSDLKKEYRRIIMDEIKRKDEKFYDKWCNNKVKY